MLQASRIERSPHPKPLCGTAEEGVLRKATQQADTVRRGRFDSEVVSVGARDRCVRRPLVDARGRQEGPEPSRRSRILGGGPTREGRGTIGRRRRVRVEG